MDRGMSENLGIAVHELGHAIMGKAWSKPGSEIVIAPTEDGWETLVAWDERRFDDRSACVASMAGILAEFAFRNDTLKDVRELALRNALRTPIGEHDTLHTNLPGAVQAELVDWVYPVIRHYLNSAVGFSAVSEITEAMDHGKAFTI